MLQFLSAILFLFSLSNDVEINGRVLDKKDQKPLPYVTISISNSIYTIADHEGKFSLKVNSDLRSFQIKARLVGKKELTQTVVVTPNQSQLQLTLFMEDNDLYMKEVIVAAERDDENISVSAFKLDRSTIEQSQANSLNELLQLIPGQEIRNPQLQGAQAINFRSSLSGQQSLNNAFGVGIFVNDNQLDNNSNMQAINPRSNGQFRSFGGTSFQANSFTSGDAPAGGFDLRQIPVGNIEKVEVIQGVASAEYGDISTGAIIIETSAGQSPWTTIFRQAGGDRNFNLGKGFQLNDKHAVHVNFDYLNSNPDLRDNVKSYNRISGGIILTSYLGPAKKIKNNLSINVNTNLDDFRIDPDFGTERRVYYQNQNFSFSDRLQVAWKTPFFDSFKAVASFNIGRSLSVLEQFVNPGVLPVTATREAGISVGTYHPSSYRTGRTIHGLPISSGANINFQKLFRKNQTTHILGYGISYRFNANYGRGREFDPLRPIRFAGAATNERPLSFREINPELHQMGFFIQDQVNTKIAGKFTNVTAGLRGDWQFGRLNLAPRLNGALHLNKNIRLTGAYGEAYKAPGLIHLFPGPQFEDITLLNSFTGRESESLFLVYTHVVPNDASGVRSMRTTTREMGLHIKGKMVNLGITGFYNSNRNGFTIDNRPVRLDLPVFAITERPAGQRPVFQETGATRPFLVTERYILNTSNNESYGLEATLSTKKIQSINTSFSLNLAYYQSRFLDARERFTRVPNWQPSQDIWFGIYNNQESESGRAISLLTASHHIPELGLVLTIRNQLFLTNFTRTFDRANRPVAYFDSNLNRVSISEEEFLNDPKFRILDQTPLEGNFVRIPDFIYTNFHLNLSKNIGKNVRFSFFANNFLNIRPQDIDIQGNVRNILNEEPYFGIELSFKY